MVENLLDSDIREKLKWFQILTTLYEVAQPHIKSFTGLECHAIEKKLIDVETISKNTHVLKQLLAVVKVIPQPSTADLCRTKQFFETAMANCITGSEALLKYVSTGEEESEHQIHLDCLINSLVMAREYSESIFLKLNTNPK